MGKQVRVNMTIDSEVVEKAKEIGLNLSKVAENALIKAIRALERMDEPNESTSHPISYLKYKNGGPGRDRTCDHRHVKAVSYH